MENKKIYTGADAFERSIPEIEKIIGYRFKDKSLLTQAFTRTSFCNEHKGENAVPYQSNEVLEFFGDSVLSASIISIFMKDFTERYQNGIKTELREGDFSNIKSRLSDKKNLSDRIEELGLYKYFRMGEGDKKLGIEREPSVMEDLFESIIGAIYIDCGMDIRPVIKSVERMLDVKKYLSVDTREKNSTLQSHKNALQEWCADKKHRLPAPIYKTVSESGPDHKKVYERACFIGERRYAVGVGKNQKLADADAAAKTLEILKKEAQPKPKLPSPDAVIKLREYSRTSHVAPPTFRDMGETESSTPHHREYSVMCRLSDVEASAVAEDKGTARCAAAEKVLILLREKSKAKPAKIKPNNENSGTRVAKIQKNISPNKPKRKGTIRK